MRSGRMTDAAIKVTELRFEDEVLARLDLPSGELRVTRGIGSGLATGLDGRIWSVGDRGPNLKVKLAVKRYGLGHLAEHGVSDGAKVMPCLEVGPALSELRVEGDRVEIVCTVPLRDADGRALSGLPVPGGPNNRSEPAIGLDGAVIAPNPSGADSEGVALLGDGGFWVGDEYGPSLLRVGADGSVMVRWVPAGCEPLFADARYPVVGALPAIAARRRLNRGFEAIALSPDERWLHLAFQSPLSHPDDEAHERARRVRLWRLDAQTGAVAAEWLYPLDAPDSFRRDAEAGKVERSDVKVSEIVAVGADRLLVLERVSLTTKLYLIVLDEAAALDPAYMEEATRPTVEELSADGTAGLPVLTKRLVLSSDDLPGLGADLEGVAMLSPRSLLIVNDNDFGIEGVATRFWRVDLSRDLADYPSAG
ncbi:esterase-like activity of phytase family protein [uncultured Sphingomonas sp.]|uniref:esterase-like activity of phytase family protein n=1 Tax=uncultured Sphingomonas sp. TaxID=158754 RepID=UPI0035CB7215